MDLVTVLALIGAILGVASTALHAIAPKTENTVDDKAEEIVDAVLAKLKLLGVPTEPPK